MDLFVIRSPKTHFTAKSKPGLYFTRYMTNNCELLWIRAPNNAIMYTTGQGCQTWWVNAAAPLCLTQLLGTGAPSAAVPAVRNPPAFPPFLPLMKTRGEDIRPSISHKSTSHMFWWISAHEPSPASSGDCPAEPYQHSSEDAVNKTTWAIADRRRLDTDRQHLSVWSCDIPGSRGLDCLCDHDHML